MIAGKTITAGQPTTTAPPTTIEATARTIITAGKAVTTGTHLNPNSLTTMSVDMTNSNIGIVSMVSVGIATVSTLIPGIESQIEVSLTIVIAPTMTKIAPTHRMTIATTIRLADRLRSILYSACRRSSRAAA